MISNHDSSVALFGLPPIINARILVIYDKLHILKSTFFTHSIFTCAMSLFSKYFICSQI
uniref:Uncharacterized protein n=1 Tax=Aegilops tauschii subsp. strangulata TaxID=200361 RepID=A0A452YGI0_AEGTS